MPIIEWQAMAPLIHQLRRLQHAANGLSYFEFCTIMGWERNDYSKHKWQEFQGLGRLGVFDDEVLARAIEGYEALGRG